MDSFKVNIKKIRTNSNLYPKSFLQNFSHFPEQALHSPAPLGGPAKPDGFLHCRTRERLYSTIRFLLLWSLLSSA